MDAEPAYELGTISHCIRPDQAFAPRDAPDRILSSSSTQQSANVLEISNDIEIGMRIKEARVKAGLSISAVAKHTGMSLAYVRLLENGKIPAPTVDRLSRIAAALDTPLKSIISEAEYSPTQRIEQHTDIIDELVSMAPNTDHEIARTFVEGLLYLSREDQMRVAALIVDLSDQHLRESAF